MTSADSPTTSARGAAPGTSPRLWTVGTLTYTAGGLVILFAWLLIGDLAWSMKERSVMWAVQLLIKKFEASDTTTGVLIGTLPQVLILVLAPLVSYLSDRHRGSWGRRIPYLLIPTPIAALSMLGLAYSPAIGGALHDLLHGLIADRNNAILIVFGVFWTLFEVATVIANAVFFALINDVVPKEVLGRFYGLFRAVGLFVAIGFNYWFFGKVEQHYTWIFIGIGCLYGFGFTVMCLKVKEGSYPPPPPKEDRPLVRGVVEGVKTYFRECFSKPYYVWISVSVALAWMAILTVNLFNLYFAKSVQMNMDTYGKCLAATFMISFVLSYFMGVLADRFHPLRLSLVLMGLFAAVTVVGGLLARDARSYGVALIAYGVVSGAWQTSTASLTLRLFPQARFAQFDSARALVCSVGMAAVGPLMGRYLDLSGHAYHYTYVIGGVMALLSAASGLLVYRKFIEHGGDAKYVAP